MKFDEITEEKYKELNKKINDDLLTKKMIKGYIQNKNFIGLFCFLSGYLEMEFK